MTTFGGATIPPIFSGSDSASGGGGNPFPTFFTLPIVMRDHAPPEAFFEVIGDSLGQVSARMEWSSGITPPGPDFGGFYTGDPVTGLDVLVAGAPQEWHAGFPITGTVANTFSVRRIADLGPDALTGGNMVIGAFRTLSLESVAIMSTLFAVKPDVKQNTGVYEIAANADLGTILARSTMTLRAENLP